MLVNLGKIKDMEKENSLSQTEVSTKEISLMVTFLLYLIIIHNITYCVQYKYYIKYFNLLLHVSNKD